MGGDAQSLLEVKIDNSDVLSKKDGGCYTRKQWDMVLRFILGVYSFLYLMQAYAASSSCSLFPTFLWFAAGMGGLQIFIGAFPLVCMGAPKFDFLFIFTDWLSETIAACKACCNKVQGSAPKVDTSKCQCLDFSKCTMPASCNKCIIGCDPCIKTFDPTKKCVARLAGFAFALPLWTTMFLPPYLIIGVFGLNYAGLGMSMYLTCSAINEPLCMAILTCTLNACLTGIRLSHGSDGHSKIDFYTQLV